MSLRKHSRTISIFAGILPVFLVFLGCFAGPQIAQAGFFDDLKSIPVRLAEGAAIVKNEIVPQGRAGLDTIWQNLAGFFGFGRPITEDPSSKFQAPNNIQISNNIQAPSAKSQTDANDSPADLFSAEMAEREKNVPDKQFSINDQTENDRIANSQFSINSQNPNRRKENADTNNDSFLETISNQLNNIFAKISVLRPPASITQTNTIVVDDATKAKVNQILRQLDSDRPNYSLGQSFTMPKNLSGDTINLASGKFLVDRDGNLILQSNLSVAGAQTLTNILSVAASSDNPLVSIVQSGAGYALQADNITLKNSIVATADSGPIQFFNSNTAINSSGNFIAGGSIIPHADIAYDLGGPAKQFNNLYSKTIYTAAINTSGQGVFNYPPATAGFADAAVLINPTAASANAILLGIGVGGSPKFTVDAEGDVFVGSSLQINNSGAITAGTWNGNVISPVYGGTGVANNTANTLTFTGNYPLGLTLANDTNLTLPTAGTVTALGNTTTGSGNVVLQTSPTLVTPSLGVAGATSINKLAITAPATGATLTIADGKTFTAANTLTLSGNDGASLAIGAGGTLGTGAYATIGNYATLANPTFTGTVTLPSPFTLGATSVTTTGTQFNYLASASGTTGTTNLVFSNSPTLVSPSLGVASATSLSAPTLTTASGDLTLDPTGNVVIKGSTADNLAAALNVTNSTPLSLLFARNDGNIGINNIAPGRKLDIIETTSATPQLRLSYDGANYAEMAVNSIGDLFLDTTGSTATSISILDQNLKVCAGGSFVSNACPTTGFNITGTGNLVVAGQVAAADYQKICPAGYIWVPGSAKYGTMPGFCVMKYEAKNVGNVATSQAALTPWVSISQENARAQCQALGAGYHLISEAEWMTIADNIAATPINDLDDDDGLQLATGHTDNVPSNALATTAAADPVVSGCNLRETMEHAHNIYNSETCQIRGTGSYVGGDTDFGYYGTGQAWSTGGYASGAANKSQLRTHILSNGNVIWDIAGNVWEWTDAIISQVDQPGIGNDGGATVGNWGEWNVAYHLVGAAANSRPPDDGWTATNGIGRLWTYGRDETATSTYRAFQRGGHWNNTSNAGVFALYLNHSPTNTVSSFGFRCAR